MGRLAVMLGGRAAEHLVFGQPTTGAESDLKDATSLARRMVGLWGMTDEVGPVSYGVARPSRSWDASWRLRAITPTRRQPGSTRRSSPSSRPHAIRRQRYFRTARPALDALADELVAHEMVDSQPLYETLMQWASRPPWPHLADRVPDRGQRALVIPQPPPAAKKGSGPSGAAGP